MTDQELLKLAAKAAGMESKLTWADGIAWQHVSPGVRFSWNPLYDDADAFQLAVKLAMSVDVDEHEESTYVYAGHVPRSYAWELWRKEPQAATRRAIVRAAAEIGKSL